jgi:hypothetical protein
MRKRNAYAGLVAGAAVAALAVVPMALGDGKQDLLRSGIAGSTPLTAPTPGPVLFGVDPAGAPWIASRHSQVRVKRNGEVRIKIRGLVIPNRTPPNPLPTLVAAVVCNGAVSVATMTDAVSFSPEGNANIRQKLMLPKTCLAPAVLFLTPAGAYIGASG